MSHKNNKATKARYHKFSLERERLSVLKKEKKAAKKLEREKNTGIVPERKVRHKPLRLKKNAVIKGIKIVDAESKRRVLELIKKDKESRMEIEATEQAKEKSCNTDVDME